MKDHSSENWGGKRSGAGRPPQYIKIPYTDEEQRKVWEVITNLVKSGEARLLDNSTKIQFADETEPTPIEYLRYSSELGLYDTRQFPSHQD
jgi:hypothetical protein